MGSRQVSRLLSLIIVFIFLLAAASPAGARSPRSNSLIDDPQGRFAGSSHQPLAETAGTGEISQIAAGWEHVCAVTNAGAVKCWGSNIQGQLGNGFTGGFTTIPVAVVGLSSGIKALGAGNLHTCALTIAGGVLCWGANSKGQLGRGSTNPGPLPVGVPGLTNGIKTVAGGNNFTCALFDLVSAPVTDRGKVKCWGYNHDGQLGDNSTDDYKSSPVYVSGLTNITAIAVGTAHACALTDTGGVKCWGKNEFGQLGIGSADLNAHRTPLNVSGLAGAITLAAGDSHTCAVNSGGGVVCWGWNFYGQLGDGTTDQHNAPWPVSELDSGISALASGGWHTCALIDPVSAPLSERGRIKCWGFNYDGQLGDGSNLDRHTPDYVVNLAGMVAITAGTKSTCALTGDGVINCWGRNHYGQLGDGTTTNRPIPVAAGYPKLFLTLIRR